MQLPPHLIIALVTQSSPLTPSSFQAPLFFSSIFFFDVSPQITTTNRSHISSFFLCWISHIDSRMKKKAYRRTSLHAKIAFVAHRQIREELINWPWLILTCLWANCIGYLITGECMACSIINCFSCQDVIMGFVSWCGNNVCGLGLNTIFWPEGKQRRRHVTSGPFYAIACRVMYPQAWQSLLLVLLSVVSRVWKGKPGLNNVLYAANWQWWMVL